MKTFLRKDTQHYCEHDSGPVFAFVHGIHDGAVYYTVDYPLRNGHLKFRDNGESSGTYVKPVADFLARFMPDTFNAFGRYHKGAM